MAIATIPSTFSTTKVRVMTTRGEVVGWLVEDDKPQVLVRGESGELSLQAADPNAALGYDPIQTGAFRASSWLVDAATREPMD